MKLYVDESGNTGGANVNANIFNFNDQPYYALAGILVNDFERSGLCEFLDALKQKHRIQSPELKAKKIYESKPQLIWELVDFLSDNNFPVFVELMDKNYYLSIQMLTFTIVRPPLIDSNENVAVIRSMARLLPYYLGEALYIKFTQTCQEYTVQAFEKFYTELRAHLRKENHFDALKLVEINWMLYLGAKEKYGEEAFKKYLPIPDSNSNNRLIHLLPNYNAFNTLVGRTKRHKMKNNIAEKIEIVHDEQPQFGLIYDEALKQMTRVDTDSLVAGTSLTDLASYNLTNDDFELKFVNSKADKAIQAADLIAGFVVSVWTDFKNEQYDKIHHHLPTMKVIAKDPESIPVGTLFVVPEEDHRMFSYLLSQY
ncbi:hypothetical protein WSM22_18200 [Cytophagales bacterium WSM2-2]|nr:hypothetical protein WSM22_18200 [Cytophagales bacterium WSM2-2]